MNRRVLVAAAAVVIASCQGPVHTGVRPPATTVPPTSGTAPPSTAPATTAGPPTTTPVQTATTTTTASISTTSTAPAQSAARLIWRGRTSGRLVALTFDAGSDTGNTAAILDVLAANRIQATFGLTGVWAQANPGLVRRIAASGHQIVDHSWDHRSFTGASTGAAPLTAAQIGWELRSTDDLIRGLTGEGSQGWCRPPYGDRNPSVDTAVGAAGYGYELMWTVDTLGWKGVSPTTVVQRALASAGPGEIILMHVGSQSTDAAALPGLISALRAQGFGFTTASGIV